MGRCGDVDVRKQFPPGIAYIVSEGERGGRTMTLTTPVRTSSPMDAMRCLSAPDAAPAAGADDDGGGGGGGAVLAMALSLSLPFPLPLPVPPPPPALCVVGV